MCKNKDKNMFCDYWITLLCVLFVIVVCFLRYLGYFWKFDILDL